MRNHFPKKEGTLLRLLLAILLTTIVLLTIEVYRYSQGDGTSFLDVPRAAPENIFFDLRIWTNNGIDCDIRVGDITDENHCASELYAFNYPRYFLYVVRFFGVTSLWHRTYGVALALCAITCMISLVARLYGECQDRQGRQLILVYLILANLSFPWRYAIERGQTDLIVFCLITLPFIFSLTKRDGGRGSLLPSNGLIMALIGTAFIKLFTLPSALCCVLIRVFPTCDEKGDLLVNKSKILAWSIAMGAVILILVPSLEATSTLNIVNLGGHGFGFKTLMRAGYVNSYADAVICKITFIALGVAIFWDQGLAQYSFKQPKKFLFKAIYNARGLAISQSYIVLATILYSSVYLATENINYKWIFVLPVPACLVVAQSLRDSHTKKLRSSFRLLETALVISIGLLSLPFSPTTYSYVEWLGHFALHPLCIGGLLGCSIRVLSCGGNSNANKSVEL